MADTIVPIVDVGVHFDRHEYTCSVLILWKLKTDNANVIKTLFK